MKKILELLHVSRKIDNQLILNNISFSVYENDCLFILGTSGCGKTTLLKILAGRDEPTSGVIKLNNKNINSIKFGDRKIHSVFCNFFFFEHMTVYQNIEFGINSCTLEIEKHYKINEISIILGIYDILHKNISLISSGQRQRAAIARAMIGQPDIILMDEPFCYLDIYSKKFIFNDFTKLRQLSPNITYIIVSHSYDEALTMGNKVAILHKGELIHFGNINAPYDKPASVIAAELTGKVITIPVIYQGHTNDNIMISISGVFLIISNIYFINHDTLFHLNDKLILILRPENVVIHELNADNQYYLTGMIIDVKILGPFVQHDIQLDKINVAIYNISFRTSKIFQINTKVSIEIIPSTIIKE